MQCSHFPNPKAYEIRKNCYRIFFGVEFVQFCLFNKISFVLNVEIIFAKVPFNYAFYWTKKGENNDNKKYLPSFNQNIKTN